MIHIPKNIFQINHKNNTMQRINIIGDIIKKIKSTMNMFKNTIIMNRIKKFYKIS